MADTCRQMPDRPPELMLMRTLTQLQFRRPANAPLSPTASMSYERRLTYWAALAGLLAGLALGFGVAWFAGGWMWAQ